MNWRFLRTVALLLFVSVSRSVEFGWTGTNSLALPQPGDHELRFLSSNLLELTMMTTRTNGHDTAWPFVGENFALNLPPASAFQVIGNGEEVPVRQVGFKRRALYAPLKTRDLRIINELYLELGSSVPEGAVIEVKDRSGKLWLPQMRFETKAESLRFSPAIHVNQVGYQTEFTKSAYVGYYLGTLGEMSVPLQSGFSLVDAVTGREVFKGLLRPHRDKGFTYAATPYQNVLLADFSEFKTPGQYRLAVPGLGASFPFEIDDGAIAAFARTYALGLYHQRCGTNNILPFTRFVHDPCHTAPAEVPTPAFKNAQRIIAEETSDAKNDPRHSAPRLENSEASLYPFVRQGKVDVSGGHHDAGDYSKYTINSAGLIHFLVFAVDNFSGAGSLDNLGLPESGDGKSDLLQEAKWEADFLAKMQDNDGGFYFLVYPRERRYEDNVLPDHGDPQIVWPKNTAASAAATAALAEIGSSPLFKKQFPEAADQYLRHALRGWAFLERALARHPGDSAYQKLTHYGHEFLHDDELGWAAAALFAATGKEEFEQRLIRAFSPENRNTRRWTWWPMFEGWGNATRTYAFAARSGRLPSGRINAGFLRRCDALILETAMNHVRWARESAYGTSFPDLNKANMNAGWFFSSERAFDMTVAFQLDARDELRDAVLSNLNFEAGANPVNVCYLTGIGWRRQREIVHQYAQNDRRVLPPSGIPLGNVQTGFAYLDPYKKELGAISFPSDGAKQDPYPLYDRWGDSFNTTTEFVIVDQARSLASLAFWMAKTPAAQRNWRAASARIVGLPESIPAGEMVSAKLEAEGSSTAQLQIVWEARDQEPVIAPEYLFKPKNVGEQWVEAEAMWPDGRRAFARASFNATASLNAKPNASRSAPLETTPPVVALYHLDRSLTDATGHAPELHQAGSPQFDEANLSWMQHRSGAALRFRDLGDKATNLIEIPKLASGPILEINLEAMIYVNGWKAYNRANTRILSLSEDWNSSLELIENMYEGPILRGGSQFAIKKEVLKPALNLTNWHHISITLNASGYTAKIDGQEVGSKKSDELARWGRKPASLEIGNFDGYIDELAVICKTGPAGQEAAIQPAVKE